MMEVSLCPFSEGTLQTVSCSRLNESGQRCAHRAVTVSMETKRDRSTQHGHHIEEDKKGTHDKAERHDAIRFDLDRI